MEVAVAGLGAGSAAVSAASEEACAEGEGGERGELGERGLVGEGLPIEGEVVELVRLGEKGVFEIG